MTIPKLTILAILQQNEYDLGKTLSWVNEHAHFSRLLTPEKWTTKLKIINLLYTLGGSQWWSLKAAVVLTTPVEYLIRQYHYSRAKQQLKKLRQSGTRVVVIAGSFAKTSTKQWLAHLFSGQLKVSSTPSSINTMLGIARWLLKDVPATTELLIIELGEYRPGDLKELMLFLEPDFGVITPIGLQHLEMFSSISALQQEFGTVLEWFAQHNHLDHVLSNDQNKTIFQTDHAKLTYYGSSTESPWRMADAQVSRAGTEADLRVPTALHIFTPILGSHQVVNALPAFWLANLLDIDQQLIRKRCATMPFIHRRHEPTFAANNVLILDNSYNTNASSVSASLALVNQLDPTKRLIITLGFTEAGERTQELNFQFGEQLAKSVDYVGLLNSPWAAAIKAGWESGGGKPDHVLFGDSHEALLNRLQSWVVAGSVILFEGGYQEAYLRSGKENHG